MQSALEPASPQQQGGMLTQDHELLQALPTAVYTTDAAGRITFYNEAAARLWGHRPRPWNERMVRLVAAFIGRTELRSRMTNARWRPR